MKRSRVAKEGILVGLLALFGLIVLPLCVYVVGTLVFGGYQDGGLGGFYGHLLGGFFRGQPAIWFLLLSPLILWQLVRLTAWGFHCLRPPAADDEQRPRR